MYKYRYQMLVGGLTWLDIEKKVSSQEILFTLAVNNLENEINNNGTEPE